MFFVEDNVGTAMERIVVFVVGSEADCDVVVDIDGV